MNKIKLIIASTVVVLVFGFRLWQTTGCQQFRGFYFNPAAVVINVESQTKYDVGVPRAISKFFHNKATATPIEISLSYVQNFEPNYLLAVAGPLGLVLTITSIARLIKTKNKLLVLHPALILIAALLRISKIDPKVTFYISAFSLYSFCLWSLNNFQSTKKIVVLVVLAVVSLWYFALNWQMPLICREILFK